MAIQEKYNITGQKFGEWTVLEDIGGGKVTCQCSCGTIKTLYKKAVKEGKTKSCGCLKSKVPLIRDDLTGKVFGQWTVLKEVGNGKVVCRCSCGTEKEVYKQALKEGKSTSCGCSYIGKIKRESSIGKVYGELTVIDEKPNGIVTCKCSCGNIKDYYLSNLEKGTTKSCGHKRVDNVVGQRFGYWTVLKELGYGKVLCKCDCGTEKEIYKKTLKEGRSKSCGCKSLENLQKQLEEKYLGKTFGYWTVIGVTTDHNLTCRCICGTEKVLTRQTVIEGDSSSCGCKQQEISKETIKYIYGDTHSRAMNPREDWQIEAVKTKEKLAEFITSNYIEKPTISELALKLDLSTGYVTSLVSRYELSNLINLRPPVSSYEDEIYRFIKSIVGDLEVRTNVRNVIPNNELDIYIPDLGLAIEINGDYWHSTLYKDKSYHINKTLICTRHNIRLIHIFEYELKNEVTKYRILNLIRDSIICEHIDSNDTTIQLISKEECQKFLAHNSYKQYVNAAYNVGLFYKNKLVHVTCIGKPRFSSKYTYEIIRNSSLNGYSVDGGLDKIIRTFIKDLNPESIIAYVDVSKYTIQEYIKAGLKLHSITPPGYVWVKNNEVLTRHQVQKDKLQSQGFVNKDNEDKSEDNIMTTRGYMKIYDCGSYKLVYEREEK